MKIAPKYQKILRLIGWIGSIAALIYMVYQLATYRSYNELWHSLCHANTWQLLALGGALVGLPIQLAIETKRWQRLLEGFAQPDNREALHQVLCGNIAAFITPWRIGEYPARLVKAGLNQEIEIRNWRRWLNDPKKWLAFALLTLARYTVWGLQLWGVLYFCGIVLTPLQAISAIATYYVAISVFPTIPAADVALKGGWAVLIFGTYTHNLPQITIAISIIWIINTIMPIVYYEGREMIGD